LFASFAGTIDESDFFAPFIIGYGLRPFRCGPGDGFPGRSGGGVKPIIVGVKKGPNSAVMMRN
jgi:hypothetical protein